MFLPENIDLAHSEKYNLSIRLAPNGFSFCIYTPSDSSVFYYQETKLGNKLSYLESIKKLIFDLGIFSNPFNKCNVIVVTPNYTLVPERFYDKEQAKDLFDFNFHDLDGVILDEPSENGDYHILFKINEELHSFISRHLYNPTFHHNCTYLINSFDSYGLNSSQNRCFVDFHDIYISIICFSDNGLLSANTFTETNSYNITYYVMGIWEKFEFDHNSDKLYVSGNNTLRDEVESELKSLIKNIEYVELKTHSNIAVDQKKEVPTDLLASLCE